ncbi:MAG: hypothetical protein ACM3SM_07070 [Bacteroidota bacterium]
MRIGIVRFYLSSIIAVSAIMNFAVTQKNIISWLTAGIGKIQNSDAPVLLYTFPATEENKLDGFEYPNRMQKLTTVKIRAARGEYEPFTFILVPQRKLESVKVTWSQFTSGSNSLPLDILDVSVVKAWYQSGVKSNQTNQRLLVGELLIKNDKLVQTDYESKSNYLLVKNSSGTSEYINISDPSARFPDNVVIEDSDELKPFTVEEKIYKQLWLTFHIPDNAVSGLYRGRIKIKYGNDNTLSVPVELTVLPFDLNESRIMYSIYYHGCLRSSKLRAFHCEDKTEKQLEIELRDMKEHGIMYPNNYQDADLLARNLGIRNKVGLPGDYMFSTLLNWFSVKEGEIQDTDKLKERIAAFNSVLSKHGYRNLHIYGIDEASGRKLAAQRPAWSAARASGAGIFVACYHDAFDIVGDILDVAVMFGELNPSQARKYHSRGKKIFSYSNPQVGQENPEVYRRNFGIALWQAGYDGAMDYAYQKNYNSIWNDFDNKRYREETFTYPLSDGLISTIQWEGFREGVDDMRYLSTLLDMIDKLKSRGRDVTAAERFVSSVDTSGDLDKLRSEIIAQILKLMKQK